MVAGVSSTEPNKLSISFARPKADSALVRSLVQLVHWFTGAVTGSV